MSDWEFHTARPADPEWWEEKQQEFVHPSYGKELALFHGTHRDNLPSILKNGLKPWNEGGGQSRWDNEFEYDPEQEWLRPRPGHTYLTPSYEQARSHTLDYHPNEQRTVLAIDPFYLDHERINPDEDAWRMRGMGGGGNLKTPYIDEDAIMRNSDPDEAHPGETVSLGDLAEHENVGEYPEDTHKLIDSHNTLAYRGAIPPEAIRHVNINGEWRTPQELQQAGFVSLGPDVHPQQEQLEVAASSLAGRHIARNWGEKVYHNQVVENSEMPATMNNSPEKKSTEDDGNFSDDQTQKQKRLSKPSDVSVSRTRNLSEQVQGGRDPGESVREPEWDLSTVQGDDHWDVHSRSHRSSFVGRMPQNQQHTGLTSQMSRSEDQPNRSKQSNPNTLLSDVPRFPGGGDFNPVDELKAFLKSLPQQPQAPPPITVHHDSPFDFALEPHVSLPQTRSPYPPGEEPKPVKDGLGALSAEEPLHQLNWSGYGRNGKGLHIPETGQVISWDINEHGEPHHQDVYQDVTQGNRDPSVMKARGVLPFNIGPAGHVDNAWDMEGYIAPEQHEALRAADPRFKLAPGAQSGGGFGHARDILDALPEQPYGEERFSKSRSLYHGTLLDHLPSIQQHGLTPEVGGFVQDAYGDMEGYFDGPDAESAREAWKDENLQPLTFMTDKPQLDKAFTAIHHHVADKLGKSYQAVTPHDIQNHGLLVKLPGQEGESTQEPPMNHLPEYEDNSGGHPYTVEPGDYYADNGVASGDMQYIHGPALVRMMNRNENQQPPKPQPRVPGQQQMFDTRDLYEAPERSSNPQDPAHWAKTAMAWPNELWHVAPTAVRSEIEAQGLRGHEPKTPSPWTHHQERGNYAYENLEDALHYAYGAAHNFAKPHDVWRINTAQNPEHFAPKPDPEPKMMHGTWPPDSLDPADFTPANEYSGEDKDTFRGEFYDHGDPNGEEPELVEGMPIRWVMKHQINPQYLENYHTVMPEDYQRMPENNLELRTFRNMDQWTPSPVHQVPWDTPEDYQNTHQQFRDYYQAHESGMTLPQEQRAWQQIRQELPAQSQVVHSWPDGWTIQDHPTNNDVQAVGKMMRNCWQRGIRLTDLGYSYQALHDPHDIPRLAFYNHHSQEMTPHGVPAWPDGRIVAPLGMRNKEDITQDQFTRLNDYATSRLDYTNNGLAQDLNIRLPRTTALNDGSQLPLGWPLAEGDTVRSLIGGGQGLIVRVEGRNLWVRVPGQQTKIWPANPDLVELVSKGTTSKWEDRFVPGGTQRHIQDLTPDDDYDPYNEEGELPEGFDEEWHELDNHPEAYEPVVEQAINHLYDRGHTEPSDAPWQGPGAWYSHPEGSSSSHLHGFTPEEEKEIYHGLQAKQVAIPNSPFHPNYPPQPIDPWMDNEPGSVTFPEHWSAVDDISDWESEGGLVPHEEETSTDSTSSPDDTEDSHKLSVADSPYDIRPADEGWFSHDTGRFIPRFDSKGNDTLQTEHGQGEGRVAYLNDEPVGSVTWQQTPQGYMIGSAYTVPEHRGKGLFNAMTQELRDSGQPVDAYYWDNPWLKNKVRDWRTSKTAGETGSQRLRRSQEIEQETGPDESAVVHQFPDGWSIRTPVRYGDIDREGRLMGNCWAYNHEHPEESHGVWFDQDEYGDRIVPGHPEWPHPIFDQARGQQQLFEPQVTKRPSMDYDDGLPYYGEQFMSLRDENNLPHLSFHIDDNGDMGNVLGRHNSEPKYEHVQRLKDWLANDTTYGNTVSNYYDWGEGHPGTAWPHTPIDDWFQHHEDWQNRTGPFAYNAKTAGWGDNDEITHDDIQQMYPSPYNRQFGEYITDDKNAELGKRPIPNYVYHASDADPSDIEDHGLLVDPTGRDGYISEHGDSLRNYDWAEPGVYTTDNLANAQNWASDWGNLYRVDTSKIPRENIYPDPNAVGAWRINQDIHPQHIEPMGQMADQNFDPTYDVPTPQWNSYSDRAQYFGSAQPTTSWHLTDNPNFALDPNYQPTNNTTMGGSWPHKGIFLGDPESWFNGHDYVRPFAAEIEHPNLDSFGGYSGENFLPAEQFPNAQVKRVIPIDEYVREQYGEPGWFETHAHEGERNMAGSLLDETGQPIRYPGYRYEGPDVRDMSPEEHARHFDQANSYIKNVRPHMLRDVCPNCADDYVMPGGSCPRCGYESPARSFYGKTAAQHNLWWKPGQAGRGFIERETGKMWTWPEEEGTHHEIAYHNNIDPAYNFHIRPDGTVARAYQEEQPNEDVVNTIEGIDPRLKVNPNLRPNFGFGYSESKTAGLFGPDDTQGFDAGQRVWTPSNELATIGRFYHGGPTLTNMAVVHPLGGGKEQHHPVEHLTPETEQGYGSAFGDTINHISELSPGDLLYGNSGTHDAQPNVLRVHEIQDHPSPGFTWQFVDPANPMSARSPSDETHFTWAQDIPGSGYRRADDLGSGTPDMLPSDWTDEHTSSASELTSSVVPPPYSLTHSPPRVQHSELSSESHSESSPHTSPYDWDSESAFTSSDTSTSAHSTDTHSDTDMWKGERHWDSDKSSFGIGDPLRHSRSRNSEDSPYGDGTGRVGSLRVSAGDPEVPSEEELRQHIHYGNECYEAARSFAGKGGYSNATYPHLKYEEGVYELAPGDWRGHAWARTNGGTVIDISHHQFDPQQPLVIAPPGSPQNAKYHADEPDPYLLTPGEQAPEVCENCGKNPPLDKETRWCSNCIDDWSSKYSSQGRYEDSPYDWNGLEPHADGNPRVGSLRVSDDDSIWQSGRCGTYAHALTQLNPQLRFGALTEPTFGPYHFFAHDDTHAYDSLGKHPLPYTGTDGRGTPLLDQKAQWYGIPAEEAGPEGPEPHIEAAKEHARNLFGFRQGRYDSPYARTLHSAWGPVGEDAGPVERLYHTAPKTARDSILQNGLQASGDPEVDSEPGVFMTAKHPQHSTDPYFWDPDKDDVYEVNTQGLPIRLDPWGLDSGQDYLSDLGGSFYHPGDIPPERLNLLPDHRQGRVSEVRYDRKCPACGEQLMFKGQQSIPQATVPGQSRETYPIHECPNCEWPHRDINRPGEGAEAPYDIRQQVGESPDLGQAHNDWRWSKTAMERGVFYHVAPRSARDSIKQQGLIGHEGTGDVESPWAGHDWDGKHGQPHGNYLFDHPEQAAEYIAALHAHTEPIPAEDWSHYDLAGIPDAEDYGDNIYPVRTKYNDEYDAYEESPYDEDDLHGIPPHLQGWDVWKTHIDPDRQRIHTDPESGLLAEHSEFRQKENPYPSQAEAIHEWRQQVQEGNGVEDSYPGGPQQYDPSYNGESHRWYTPDHVPPEQLEHHSYTPYWGVAQSYEDNPWAEDIQQQQVPEQFTRVPTQRYFGADYYHVAPTTERARIHQHGLQPSKPHLNERWYDEGDYPDSDAPSWLKAQPEGVYAEPDPEIAYDMWGREQFFNKPEPQRWDLWRIPQDQIDENELEPDRVVDDAVVIPHPVQPQLEKGPEHRFPWPSEWPKEAAQDGDGYVTCDQGHTHWGVNGAAGAFLRHPDSGKYFLTYRSPETHQGDCWGIPGGAMQSHEQPHEAAMRETQEEVGHRPNAQVTGVTSDDHGGWAYHTVHADVPEQFESAPQDWETSDTGWFSPEEIDTMNLHPGFANTWNSMRRTSSWWNEHRPEEQEPEVFDPELFEEGWDPTGYYEMDCPHCAAHREDYGVGRIPNPRAGESGQLPHSDCPHCQGAGVGKIEQFSGGPIGGDGVYLPRLTPQQGEGVLPPAQELGLGPERRGAYENFWDFGSGTLEYMARFNRHPQSDVDWEHPDSDIDNYDQHIAAIKQKLAAGEPLVPEDFHFVSGGSECFMVAGDLAGALPGFRYVESNDEQHAWVQGPDGTVIDPTHYQFDPTRPVMIAAPGTPEHREYEQYAQSE